MTATDAATIAALLEELKEVDFETWKDCKFLLSNMMLWPEPNEQPLEQNAYQDIIQGCIQRAICQMPECHGLLQWDGIRAIARVYRNIGVFFQPEIIAESEADTPAAAILAAYVQAKRAGK